MQLWIRFTNLQPGELVLGPFSSVELSTDLKVLVPPQNDEPVLIAYQGHTEDRRWRLTAHAGAHAGKLFHFAVVLPFDPKVEREPQFTLSWLGKTDDWKDQRFVVTGDLASILAATEGAFHCDANWQFRITDAAGHEPDHWRDAFIARDWDIDCNKDFTEPWYTGDPVPQWVLDRLKE